MTVQSYKQGRGRPKELKIPTKFQILGHTVKTSFAELPEGVLGYWDNEAKTVQLSTELLKHAPSVLEQIFMHELSHCVLFHMGEDELAENEQFVDLMGELLFQVLKSSKGDLVKVFGNENPT